MKKKLIIGVLALSMCFAMSSCDVINGFFGQNSSTSSTTESEYDVEAAAEVLYDSLVDKDEETRVDYKVPNTLTYLKNVYTITWSVNVTEGVTLTRGETETDVVVNKNAQADIEYVLTAVVTDPNGATKTIEFERKVLQAPALTPEAISAKPEEGKAYKLYVYQSTKQIDCYFTGLMSGYYFKTSEDYTEGVDVYVEYVEGSTDLFNLYFTHVTDGKQYIGVEISGTHSNAVFKSSPVSQFSYSTQYNTIITNVEGTDYYLGNYSSYDTIQASAVSHASSSNVGGLVEMIDKNNIAPEKKVATVKDTLSVQAEHRMNKEIELPSYDERFTDVTIEWALSETTAATLSDGKLTLTIPTEATNVTLTATIKCGETKDTKEFTLKLGPAIVLGSNPTEAEIVNAVFSLATNEALDGEFTLSGKITKIKTAYNEEYKNITVIISTNDKEIECFRLKGTGADALKVGDTIEVKGTLKNYNGTVEFDSGCVLLSVSADQGGTDTPTTPVAGSTLTIPEAIAFGNTFDKDNYSEGKYYIVATVKEVTSTTYGNMTVVDADGNTLTIYGTYSADGATRYDKMETKPVAGDTVKLYGIIGKFNAPQMKNAWIVEHTPATSTPDQGGDETPNLPAANSTITIEQALTIGGELSQDTTTENKYYVSGKITAITNATEGEFTIEDENGKSIKVYKSFNSTGEVAYGSMQNKPTIGDTVKLYSVVSNYYGAQLKNAWIVEVTVGVHEVVELPVEGKAYSLKVADKDIYATEVSQNGKYLVTAATAGLSFTFEKVANTDNQYYIKLSTGKYLNATTSKDNNISVKDTPCTWVFNTETKQIQLAEDTSFCLQYNSTNPRISRYKGTQINVWFEEISTTTEA